MKLYNVVSVIKRINSEVIMNPHPLPLEQAKQYAGHHDVRSEGTERVLELREVKA